MLVVNGFVALGVISSFLINIGHAQQDTQPSMALAAQGSGGADHSGGDTRIVRRFKGTAWSLVFDFRALQKVASKAGSDDPLVAFVKNHALAIDRIESALKAGKSALDVTESTLKAISEKYGKPYPMYFDSNIKTVFVASDGAENNSFEFRKQVAHELFRAIGLEGDEYEKSLEFVEVLAREGAVLPPEEKLSTLIESILEAQEQVEQKTGWRVAGTWTGKTPELSTQDFSEAVAQQLRSMSSEKVSMRASVEKNETGAWVVHLQARPLGTDIQVVDATFLPSLYLMPASAERMERATKELKRLVSVLQELPAKSFAAKGIDFGKTDGLVLGGESVEMQRCRAFADILSAFSNDNVVLSPRCFKKSETIKIGAATLFYEYALMDLDLRFL